MHWFDEYESSNEISKTITVVINNTLQTKLRTPKYYVVAECAAEGSETDIETIEKEIFSILNTIRLGRDIPAAKKTETR